MNQAREWRFIAKSKWVSLAMLTVLLALPVAEDVYAGAYTRDQLIEDARELARVIEETHPDPFVHCGGRISFYRALQDVLAVSYTHLRAHET